MGFNLVSSSLFILTNIILFYNIIYNPQNEEDYTKLYHSIAGYGLGASFIALFCRVGGGIYTKAADVGADLVSKLELNWEEDDIRNPACIADNVGDNVGDIAGMGADLFSSLSETLSASLLIASSSKHLLNSGGFLYPLTIISIGILVSILTSKIGLSLSHKIDTYNSLEWNIKMQLLLSFIILLPSIVLVSFIFLPSEYNITFTGVNSEMIKVSALQTMVCPLLGLFTGLCIGFSTEYYTSLSHSPVDELVTSCQTNPAVNIIMGISLGFYSNIIPTAFIVITVYFSFYLSGMFGISLAAIGMLSNLPICLAIDGFGPIADNAGGIASMCGLDENIRDVTDKLDAAGNTTAAIGKGFAIGSATLCALSLFGVFVTATNIIEIDALNPLVMGGVLFGSTIPYVFSAFTLQAVGVAAEEMVEEIRSHTKLLKDKENKKTEVIAKDAKDSLLDISNSNLNNINNISKSDSNNEELLNTNNNYKNNTNNSNINYSNDDTYYQKCISIATNSSLKEMIYPVA